MQNLPYQVLKTCLISANLRIKTKLLIVEGNRVISEPGTCRAYIFRSNPAELRWGSGLARVVGTVSSHI